MTGTRTDAFSPDAGPALRGVVGRAIDTHRGGWRAIAVAAVVALVPAAVLQGLVGDQAIEEASHPLLVAVLAAAALGGGILGYFFLSGVIAQIAVARRRGEGAPALMQIARALPWRSLLVVDLIVSLGTAVGLELLIVPGVIFGARFGLAAILVETRHLRPRAALMRSLEITRGRLWSVVVVMIVPLLGVSALAYLIEVAAGAVIPGDGALELGLGALIAALAIKPFSTVVLVELAIELDGVRSR